jgi:hypothetical protein
MSTVKRAWSWLQDPNVRVVAGILAVLVVPAIVTLYTVKMPLKPSDFAQDPTPLGYTVSLLIYLVPVLILHRWFCRSFDDGGIVRVAARARRSDPAAPPVGDYRRNAYRLTLATLIPIGFLLDIILGLTLLTFENPKAVFFEYRAPALDFASLSFRPHIPVEEFVFYTLGFMAILGVYIWCDEYWLKLYNVPDYEIPRGKANRGLPPFIAQVMILKPLVIATVLVAAAWHYKKFFAPVENEGFPTYFAFLVVASLLPSILLFKSTQRFINWQAVSFTVFWVALTSIFWEATLAAPYGWWGYQKRHMMGVFVGAWFGLPVEAVVLWLSVTFTTVMVYETFKILLSMKRVCHIGWRTAIFGQGGVAGWLKREFRPVMATSDTEDAERALAENVSGISGNRP